MDLDTYLMKINICGQGQGLFYFMFGNQVDSGLNR